MRRFIGGFGCAYLLIPLDLGSLLYCGLFSLRFFLRGLECIRLGFSISIIRIAIARAGRNSDGKNYPVVFAFFIYNRERNLVGVDAEYILIILELLNEFCSCFKNNRSYSLSSS